MRSAARVAAWLLVACASCSPAPPASPGPAVHFAIRGRWDDPTSLRYSVEQGSGPVDAATFERAVREALDVWGETGVVGFVEVEERDEAEVVFGWRGDSHDSCQPFGRDESVAHAGPVGTVTFVHFDVARDWQGETLSLFQVAVHEVGHVLGLDHSSDSRAAMRPEPDPARCRLTASDLAGIHSLYGGGEPGPGDVAILPAQGDDRPFSILRRVAPPDTTELTLFDSDGDGDAELLVWRTDEGAEGALTIYHFASGPRLVESRGPFYGLIPPGSRPVFVRGPSGERLVLGLFGDGRFSACGFDDEGLLVAWVPPGPFDLGDGLADADGDGALDGAPEPGPLSIVGDLDGDGALERVAR